MKNTTVETQNGIDGTIKPGVIKPLIFNSTTASERRPALPPPIEPAPINRSAAAPAPFSATQQQQTALQQFHANASDYFADVVPPQLSEFHLQNSRMVPTRDHILPLMPKGGICAEVGTQTGGFAKLILSVLQPSKLHIYDIDYTVFDRAHFASAIQNGMVELHQGDSSSLLGQLPDQHFDFIYVDGDHSYEGVVRDLAVAARKIKDDGWIVCNDYTLYSPLEKTKYGVYRAVNELCLNQGFEIVYLGLHKWGYHDVALRKANAASPSRAPIKHSAAISQNVNGGLSLDAGLTVELGEHSYIHDRTIRNPSGALTNVRIGKFCSIATDLTIIGYDHHHEWISTYPFLDKGVRPSWPGTEGIPYPQAPEFGSNKNRGDIVIGNDVWIGYNVKLFKGIEIGDGAVIGACSLVNKSVEPYTIVAGTPARPIRKRFTENEIAVLRRIAWWTWPEELINRYLPVLCSSQISELEKQLEQDATYAQFKGATANGVNPS